MNPKKLYLMGGLLCVAVMLGFVILYFQGGSPDKIVPALIPQSSSQSGEEGSSAGESSSSQTPASSSSSESASQESSSSQEASSKEEEEKDEENSEESSQETVPVSGSADLNQINEMYVIGGENGLCYRVTDNNDKRQILSALQSAAPTGETPKREDPRPDTIWIRMKNGSVSSYQVSDSQIIQGSSLCRSTESQREKLMETVMICQQDYPPRPQWIAWFQPENLVKVEFSGQSADQLRTVKTTITDGEDLREIGSAIAKLDVDKRRDGERTDDYVRQDGPGQYDRYRLTFADGTVYTLYTDDFTMVVHREGDSYGMEYHIDDAQIFQMRELMKRLAENTAGSVIQTVVE